MKRIIALLLIALIPSLHSVRAQETSIAPPPASQSVAAEHPDSLRTAPRKEIPEGWVQTGEISILDPRTGERITEPSYGPPSATIFELYRQGGIEWMTPITLCLIALLFAAWKAPRWVRELGLLALVFGMFSMLIGFYYIADAIHAQNIEIGRDLSSIVLFSALRVALIAPLYGLIVYALSLVVRIALKPRI